MEVIVAPRDFVRIVLRVPQTIRLESEESVRMTADYAAGGAREAVPRATGTLQRSIVVQQRGMTATVAARSPYAIAVERGRGPGRMPPAGSLLGWMAARGIPGGAEYLIRRAIFRRGTKPQPFMRVAYDRAKQVFLNDLRSRMIGLWR